MFAKAVVVSALVSSAFATLFITNPTNSSSFAAGQSSTISWIDQNGAPSLQDWGKVAVFLATGNAIQQTKLQTIQASVDATTGSVQFTPDASVGPSTAQYFIRIESIGLKDNKTGYPVMSFSSQFALSGMKGTFNSTVQAEIDGQSTAPIGGSTSAGAPTAGTGSSSTAASTTTGSSSAKSTSTTASAQAANKTNTNGAMSSAVANVWISAVFGAAFLALML